MNEGPYRGHVPAKKPYTLADSLREYSMEAKIKLDAEHRARAVQAWPKVVELMRDEAKEGKEWLGLTPEILNSLGIEQPWYFKELAEENGLKYNSVTLAASPYHYYISWTPKTSK